MGVASAKQFRQALHNGDEDAAIDLYHSLEDLRDLNPSKSDGMIRKTTPMHYAAKRGFSRLFKEFLANGGSPNVENHKKQSVVHELCKTTHASDPTVEETRAEMLQFLIDFCTTPTKVCSDTSKPLKPQLLDLNKQDRTLNTPLHLAAISGLTRCVEILIAHGALTNTENVAKQTPFDCAEAASQQPIMAMLEPMMVFSHSKGASALKFKSDDLRQESYQGMREQELQEVKDSLVLHMSSLLGLPLSSSTALLHAYGWSQDLLINTWFEDAQAACDKAKIRLPLGHQFSLTEASGSRQVSMEERECEICTEIITEFVPIPCGHSFCKGCWKDYLELKITEGQVAELQCPSYGCSKIVPAEVVASIIPKDVEAKYLKFGIDAFVQASSNMKWCPHPGCGRAVCLPSSEVPPTTPGPVTADDGGASASTSTGDTSQVNAPPRTVDCGMGHFFCWACNREAHDPCDCELWTQWKEEASKHDSQSSLVLSATSAAQLASSDTWITKHSKPCPNCKAPIEKSDGCNHMTCSNCQHDFCWVCTGPWQIHGRRTGGYYSCNRFRAARNATKRIEKAKESATVVAKRRQSKYFKHIYSRYINHSDSLRYEEELLGNVKEKAAALIEAALGSGANINRDTVDGKFVEDAVRELLKARCALRATYAMSYYIDSDTDRYKVVKLVARLEKSTEGLAEMIARPHLRTPMNTIILATLDSREVRRKFLPEARKFNPAPTLPVDEVLENEELDPVHPESTDDSDWDSDGSDWSDES